MLTKKMEAALNKQIVMEAYSTSAYLTMAIWAEIKGLRGTTSFFYAQSDEERMHMLKLVKYINASGGKAHVPAVKEPPAKYKSLKDLFEVALAQEQDVTKSISGGYLNKVPNTNYKPSVLMRTRTPTL